MKLIKFEPIHLMLTQLRDIDAETIEAMTTPDRMRLFHNYKHAGPSWTLVDKDNLVIGCGGVALLWDGVGEAWTLVSKRGERYPLAIYKHVKACLENIINLYGLHRVQAVCIRGQKTSYRWLRKLGFKPEGIARRYLPGGQDVMRFARIN